MNCLYVLVAPSAVGKSALLQKLKTERMDSRFFWRSVNKYSTRDCRGVEDDVVDIDGKNDDIIAARKKYEPLKKARDAYTKLKKAIDDYPLSRHHEDAYKKIVEELNSIDFDELKFKDAEDALRAQRFHYMRSHCEDIGSKKKGIVYHINTNLYGFNFDEISECLKTDNAVIICSDFDTISKLRSNENFGALVRVVYIASSMDEKILLKRYKERMSKDEQAFDFSEEGLKKVEEYNNLMLSAGRLQYYEKIEEVMPKLSELWNSMLKYYNTICARKEKIRLLFNQYIENIGTIDHVILNFYDLEFMYAQMRMVIRNNNLAKPAKKTPVFMVCAAPSSGKGTLMEIVGDIGKVDNSLVQVTKYAKKEKKLESLLLDRRDGMIAIGKHGDFSAHIKGEIWKWTGHKTAGIVKLDGEYKTEKEYAVSFDEIKTNIERGIPQIFISNFYQIENARNYFKDNIVILYLHATHDTETVKHIQKKSADECRRVIREKIIENAGGKENISDDEVQERILKYWMLPTYVSYRKQKEDADIKEIRATHDAYIEFIDKVDHVLLNTGTQDDLILQMLKVLEKYRQTT